MTTEEYKKLKPQDSHLEGDKLWDAMTDYMLLQQSGDENGYWKGNCKTKSSEMVWVYIYKKNSDEN